VYLAVGFIAEKLIKFSRFVRFFIPYSYIIPDILADICIRAIFVTKLNMGV